VNAEITEGSSSDAAATLTGHFAASELRAGDVLGGRFRIESLIGIGGMGVVYRAHDLSLEIDVALKLLRPDLARRPEAFKNFRQELLLARQVSSPHVVRIHDIAEHDGRWFISMDYIRGESLADRLDHTRRLPVEQVITITRGLLDGLGAAHQRGVVHRDLKPANVLLDEDHAYITDFGVARILGTTGMTQTGMIIGTPEYLSPEQARGTTIDARSDLYAVGLIFYEMLAGELPFSGGTPAEAVVQRILRPPPSLAKMRPDLPAWLHAFSERLLKVNPAHRFGSARETLRALETQRVPRPPLNRRALSFAILAVLVLAGARTWLWLHPWTPRVTPAVVISATPRIGVPVFAAAANDAELVAVARAFTEHLGNWLRNDPAIAAIPLRRLRDAQARIAPDLQGDALLRQLPDIANAANANRLIKGELRRDAQGVLLELGWIEPGNTQTAQPLIVHGKDVAELFQNYEAAVAPWLAASKVQVGAAPQLPPAALQAFGHALLDLDQHNAQAPATSLAALAATDPDSALIQLALLDAQETAHQQLPAENTRELVLKQFENDTSPLGRELLARALANDDGDKARKTLEQAMRVFPHDPALSVLDAQTLAANGGGVEALALLRQFVKTDDQDARAWFLLGRTSIQQGQAQAAIDEYLVRALVLNTRGRDAAAEAETRNALGVGYERLGQLDASAEQYTRAATMREQLGDKIGLSKTLRNLAIVQAERGERDTAERTLDRVKGILEDLGDRASLADLYNDRGVIAEERGDLAGALAAYREALAIRQQLDLPDQVAESLNNVAFSSFQLGQFDTAMAYWQQAGALYKQLNDSNGMLRIEQSIGLLDIARGHFASARERLLASLRSAEDGQLSEEAAAGHLDLATLSLAEGRYADALDHAERARQFAARRSDLRIAAEGSLLKARAADALGDDAGVDAILSAMPFAELNSEQRAMFLLAAARRAQADSNYALANSKLDEAAKAAAEAHSGKVGLEIQLQRVRLALAEGKPARIAKLLEAIRSDATHLGEVPVRLEWLELEMAVALNTGDPASASRRYREALPLLKDVGRYADAFFIHRLGARARAASAPEKDAANTAADAAREQLLADAPPDARTHLQERIARRLREEGGGTDAH
jgi:Flp pilus assembly protein TadD/predicted Ser/Thr protein kinase